MTMPPRVPNGRPGSRRSCERSSGMRNESIVDERRRRADGEAADLVGGAQIALEQRRRQLQHAADVVEAVARVVAGQQRSRRRRRRRADRGRRCDTRCGSSGGTARCGPDPATAAAARSSSPVEPRQAAPALSPAAGLGPPSCGGIMPACSLRTTCSQIAASAPTSSKSSDSSDRSAVRSASSWQSKQ